VDAARIALAAAAGGGVAWLWGAISWMALPWQRRTFARFSDEDAVARVVAANAPRSGVYGIPSEPHGATKEELAASEARATRYLRDGPLLLAVVTRGGFPPAWKPVVGSFVIYTAAAFLFGGLVSLVPGLSVIERALFIAAAALAGAFITRMSDWNWHCYPGRYTAVRVADAAIGWFLAGWAIAAVL
jgi:hypothetical protein